MSLSVEAWFINLNDTKSETKKVDEKLLSLLTQPEIVKCEKFMFPEDKRRAMYSYALQKAVIRKHFNLSDNSFFDIEYSNEGKPFCRLKNCLSEFNQQQRFNYNVSHHGSFIGIVGLDIVDTLTRVSDSDSGGVMSANEYLSMFEQQLHPIELQFIKSRATRSSAENESEAAVFSCFFHHWGLKEAFSKAIGVGLGFDLRQARFAIKYASENGENETSEENKEKFKLLGSASLFLSGELRADWVFDIFKLDERHVACVARGPAGDALSTYQELAWTGLSPLLPGVTGVTEDGQKPVAEECGVECCCCSVSISDLTDLMFPSKEKDLAEKPAEPVRKKKESSYSLLLNNPIITLLKQPSDLLN